MNFKNQKNLMVMISVVAALLTGTVLLGAYAGIKPAGTGSESTVKGCNGTPCTTECPKPCCSEKSAEGCDNPCPIPCPKPCCAEDAPKGCCGTAETTGCCAAKTAIE